METSEKWRLLTGFGDFEISNQGRIRNGERIIRPDGNRVRIRRDGVTAILNVRDLMQEHFPEVVDQSILGETWKTIPGFDGLYEISDQNRVRSLGRVGADGRTIRPKILTTSRNNGYLVAYLGGNGRTGEQAKKLYIEAMVETIFGIKPKILDEMTNVGEEWREISGYEGLYEVSNHGRIRSIGWYVNGGPKRRYIRPKLRTPNITNVGYLKVELALKGSVKTCSVHRLVAGAFVPNPLNLEVVHHRDENKVNNRDSNLEWVSRATNVQDWFDRRRVVVSTDTIDRIAEALAAGKTPAEILASLPRKRKKS